MKRIWRTMLRPYQAALHAYLNTGISGALKPAMKLGRQAESQGLKTSDLALIHEQAMIPVMLAVRSVQARRRFMNRAKVFFARAIVPMEREHRATLKINANLSRLNQSLSQRTLELLASNRQLVKEITKRRAVEERLRRSKLNTIQSLAESKRLQEQLRLVSRRVLSAQEEERKRISRELHDVIAQLLTGINVRLATLKVDVTNNTRDISGKITRTQRLVEKSVDIVHRFARDLRPAALDDLGLIPALHSYMKIFARETGMRASLTAFAGAESLSNAKRTVLYRVAHEALNNAARHAKTDRVEVNIHKLPNAIGMTIVDKGRGFEPKQVLSASRYRRLGLLGIRERVEMVGGSVVVESAEGKGTTLRVEMPLQRGPNKNPRETIRR